MPDNSIHLRQAAAARRANALDAAKGALQRLDQARRPITFRAVAAEAGVSRSWLYRDPTMRAEVERLRSRKAVGPVAVPASQRSSDESLRQRLGALHAEVTRLRDENQRPKAQWASELGRRRASAT
jgi:hypothetical protein